MDSDFDSFSMIRIKWMHGEVEGIFQVLNIPCIAHSHLINLAILLLDLLLKALYFILESFLLSDSLLSPCCAGIVRALIH